MESEKCKKKIVIMLEYNFRHDLTVLKMFNGDYNGEILGNESR